MSKFVKMQEVFGDIWQGLAIGQVHFLWTGVACLGVQFQYGPQDVEKEETSAAHMIDFHSPYSLLMNVTPDVSSLYHIYSKALRLALKFSSTTLPFPARYVPSVHGSSRLSYNFGF